MIAFGAVVLMWPEPALIAFMWLFGIYAILDGIASFVHARRTRSNVGLSLSLGVVSVIAGIVALVWPSATAVVALMIVAVWVILLGVLQLAAGVSIRSIPNSGWGWLAAAGATLMLLGFFLIAAPAGGILVILTFVGTLNIVAGILLVIAAIAVRRAASRVG